MSKELVLRFGTRNLKKAQAIAEKIAKRAKEAAGEGGRNVSDGPLPARGGHAEKGRRFLERAVELRLSDSCFGRRLLKHLLVDTLVS